MRPSEVAALYRKGLTIEEIAEAIGEPWPRVHLAVFDMKRSGALPRKCGKKENPA